MNFEKLGAGVFAVAACLMVVGCTTEYVPARPRRTTVVVTAPPPGAPVVLSADAYVPAPHDVYISAALDSDVVFLGGFTYIWYIGPDGHRYRHLYGRGDMRAEIFHRREHLHSVMAHYGGHLPSVAERTHGIPPGAALPGRPMEQRPQGSSAGRPMDHRPQGSLPGRPVERPQAARQPAHPAAFQQGARAPERLPSQPQHEVHDGHQGRNWHEGG